jgi:hypothetical protein
LERAQERRRVMEFLADPGLPPSPVVRPDRERLRIIMEERARRRRLNPAPEE